MHTLASMHMVSMDVGSEGSALTSVTSQLNSLGFNNWERCLLFSRILMTNV